MKWLAPHYIVAFFSCISLLQPHHLFCMQRPILQRMNNNVDAQHEQAAAQQCDPCNLLFTVRNYLPDRWSDQTLQNLSTGLTGITLGGAAMTAFDRVSTGNIPATDLFLVIGGTAGIDIINQVLAHRQQIRNSPERQNEFWLPRVPWIVYAALPIIIVRNSFIPPQQHEHQD